MSHDDRVDLLRRLPPQVSEALLRLVDEADRRDIAKLFRYAENTVGAIMTTDYAWLPANLTTGQAIERLRPRPRTARRSTTSTSLDEATRRMLGVLSLRALIMSDPGTPIRDVMLSNDVVTLKATDDREKAAEALDKVRPAGHARARRRGPAGRHRHARRHRRRDQPGGDRGHPAAGGRRADAGELSWRRRCPSCGTAAGNGWRSCLSCRC